MKGKAYAFLALIFLPLLVTTLLVSCEECSKCGFDQPQPYFNVKLINSDSLKKVVDSLVSLDTARIQYRDAISVLEDSLLTANDEEAEIIISKIDSLELEVDTVTSQKTLLSAAKRKIEGGYVYVKSLSTPAGNSIVFNENSDIDSVNAFRFPLSMNDNSVTYFIKIAYPNADSTYVLKVSYKTELLTENGAVVVKANSLVPEIPAEKILPVQSQLDSLDLYYRNDLKLTDETYLYLYY